MQDEYTYRNTDEYWHINIKNGTKCMKTLEIFIPFKQNTYGYTQNNYRND